MNEFENYCDTFNFNLFIEFDYEYEAAVVLFKFDCNNDGFDNDFGNY